MLEIPLKAGMAAGLYPERSDGVYSRLDEICLSAITQARHWMGRGRDPLRGIAERVSGHEHALQLEGESSRRQRVQRLRLGLRRQGFRNELVAEAFATVREVARIALGMRHHDAQLLGGWVLLSGCIAEMETGEGKTLTATLPAVTAALAGVPVHVITVNDYLAERDAELMRPLYEAFGLNVGVATGTRSDEQRRAAYRCDVTYCTNKTLAFDYLRDRITIGERTGKHLLGIERLEDDGGHLEDLFLRGLYFAIVDEADSILVDEARTPLIISRESRDEIEQGMVKEALWLAGQLEVESDFHLSSAKRMVSLTPTGRDRVAALAEPLSGLWSGRRRREEQVRQALSALHLFERDKQYLVRDGKVQIIDEYTGRVMPDRSWERGLHQLVEAKEGCEVSGLKETLARISYQRFFRRYHHLSGMTGTAMETAGELEAVYGLRVVAVPTHRPIRRSYLPRQVFDSEQRKWSAVVERVSVLHARGRPVLVGTRSVRASEQVSALLTQIGLPHQVLNARQDMDEAAIVAAAGARGRVTIATNMAGRGTDIKLGEGVEPIGGLHVILTERHEARRIDRQLFGRCGRQGDRGSVEEVLSLEDELAVAHLKPVLRRLGQFVTSRNSAFGHAAGHVLLRLAQRRAERMYSRVRRSLVKADRHIGTMLAFAGRPE